MLVIIALAYALTALPSTSASCGPIDDVTLTFYGWPDNSPPGSDNAYDCGRGKNADGEPKAGGKEACDTFKYFTTPNDLPPIGSGTYDDPISFATATDNKQNLPQCAIVYVPLLRKYFRNEDDCAECLTDWNSKKEYHIDLWTGSNTAGGGQNQIDCEDDLPGGSQTIIVEPPNSLPVDTTPLYDQPSNQCHKATYSVPDSSSLCAGGSGGFSGSASSSLSKTPKTSSTLSATNHAASIYPTGTGYRPSTLSTVSSAPSSSSSASGSTSCTWEGHCRGDPCHAYNDCFGSDICTNGVCAPCTGSSC